MIANLLLLTGEDDYRLVQRRNFYRDAFRNKFEDGEVEFYDESHAFSDLENAVMTPNLFGSKRLIFTEGFWDAEKFEKAEKSKFFEVLPDQAEHCTVMVIQGSLDKRLKFSKFLLKNAKVEEFKPMEENELIEWMIKFAEKEYALLTDKAIASGDGLSRAMAKKLLARCGENCWTLSQEIKKLMMASEGGAITEAMILELTVPNPSAVIWDFLAELSKKNVQKSLSIFSDLMEMGESVHQIFAMIVREIRIHAMLRDGLDQGMDAKSIAGATKLHPFVVQKTLSLTRQFSKEQIEDLYDQLYAIDRRLKTGGIFTTTDDAGEFELAVEKVIVGMGA